MLLHESYICLLLSSMEMTFYFLSRTHSWLEVCWAVSGDTSYLLPQDNKENRSKIFWGPIIVQQDDTTRPKNWERWVHLLKSQRKSKVCDHSWWGGGGGNEHVSWLATWTLKPQRCEWVLACEGWESGRCMKWSIRNGLYEALTSGALRKGLHTMDRNQKTIQTTFSHVLILRY